MFPTKSPRHCRRVHAAGISRCLSLLLQIRSSLATIKCYQFRSGFPGSPINLFRSVTTEESISIKKQLALCCSTCTTDLSVFLYEWHQYPFCCASSVSSKFSSHSANIFQDLGAEKAAAEAPGTENTRSNIQWDAILLTNHVCKSTHCNSEDKGTPLARQ